MFTYSEGQVRLGHAPNKSSQVAIYFKLFFPSKYKILKKVNKLRSIQERNKRKDPERIQTKKRK